MFYKTIICALRVDLLHANWVISGCVAGVVSLILRKPVLTTLRGSDVKNIESSTFVHALMRILLHTNIYVVCVSSSMQEKIRALFPAYTSRIRFISNGVADSFLQIPLAHSANNSTFRIISVGTLIPRKALHLIIEAIAKLPTLPLQLTLIGEGQEYNRLRHLSEVLGCADRVVFSGKIPPPRMHEMYSNADVFVLSSTLEGRPNVILEAMAAGLPVIASNIDGVNELIEDGHTGLLFQPENVCQLAACIERLVLKPELIKRIGKAARQWILDKELTWETTGMKYADLYAEVLDKQRGKLHQGRQN